MLYTVEPQAEIHIPLSVLLDAVGYLSEDGLRQLRQWVDERLATFATKVDTPEGRPGQALTRFAGLIPSSDLILMQEVIENDCERIDIDEW
jgi:hypothetical protein